MKKIFKSLQITSLAVNREWPFLIIGRFVSKGARDLFFMYFSYEEELFGTHWNPRILKITIDFTSWIGVRIEANLPKGREKEKPV